MRTTKIRSMEKDDDQIILQGYEIGLGWTLAIDRVTGNARITFAGWNSYFHYLRGLYCFSIERVRAERIVVQGWNGILCR